MKVFRKRNARLPQKNERGLVLVVALLMVSALVVLGSTAVITSSTDLKISANYKASEQAFYIAEAGLEAARNKLKTNAGTYTIGQLLAARVGANNALSNSDTITNFFTGGAFVTDDVPYVAQTSFGAGNYRAYLTNAATLSGVTPVETVTSASDSDLRVTLTAFGQGPNNAFAVVQAVVKQYTLPPLPGAIVLPGPGVTFHGGNSNASGVDGMAESAITLTSAASQTAVVNNLTSINRINNYTCQSPPCINNEVATIAPTWNSVNGLEGLYTTLKSMADVVVGSHGTTTTLTSAQVGTTANRKIVVVDGNAVLGPVNGAGILVVTGQLNLQGNFNYNGLIICIGQGRLLRDGGGNGDIVGSILVANTRDTSNNLLSTLGSSTYNTNGGGNSDIVYNAGAASLPAGSRPFIIQSWKQH